jgi:hypothetical protein
MKVMRKTAITIFTTIATIQSALLLLTAAAAAAATHQHNNLFYCCVMVDDSVLNETANVSGPTDRALEISIALFTAAVEL